MIDIHILGASLDVGQTLREVCPRCNGGSSTEKSLTITKNMDGSIVWNCFRDKCPERGGNVKASSEKQSPPSAPKPHKRFEGDTQPLSEQRLTRVRDKWGITNPPYWYWTNDYGGRIAMSIRSPRYMHRGWVLRDMRGRSKLKALTYLDPEEVQLSWYRTNNAAPTVLVEDIPSAVRASMCGVNAVALLGTIMNEDKATEIATYAPRPIVIALDQDATAKAFHILYKYSLMWGDAQVLPLDKDLKDMTEEQLQETLNRIRI